MNVIAPLTFLVLSTASIASSQSLSALVQKEVAQHIKNAELTIGSTRSFFMEAAMAADMSCQNLNDEATAVACFPSGAKGLTCNTARFGPKDLIASYSLDFGLQRMCSVAKSYMFSKYGKPHRSETAGGGSSVFYWSYPQLKNRLLSYQEFPPVTRTTQWGTTEVAQWCHVTYGVGQLVRPLRLP